MCHSSHGLPLALHPLHDLMCTMLVPKGSTALVVCDKLALQHWLINATTNHLCFGLQSFATARPAAQSMAPTGYQPSAESFATAAPATATQAGGSGYADSFATATVIVDARMCRDSL